MLWLAGNRRSDTLRIKARPVCTTLWLAGNRRSDTLTGIWTSIRDTLWLAGNRRSDTLLAGPGLAATRCGLRGIVARIH